jgi:hypothetical protein
MSLHARRKVVSLLIEADRTAAKEMQQLVRETYRRRGVPGWVLL